MGDPVTAMAIGSLVMGAGATTHQVIQGKKAEKKMDKANTDAKEAMAQKEFEAQQEQERMNAVADRDRERIRQKSSALGSTGRQGTLLTGPLGITGGTTGGTKTLLGM